MIFFAILGLISLMLLIGWIIVFCISFVSEHNEMAKKIERLERWQFACREKEAFEFRQRVAKFEKEEAARQDQQPPAAQA